MEELKDKYIRFDWAIKRLLRQKANFGVLEGFLTVFIGEPIKIILRDRITQFIVLAWLLSFLILIYIV